MSRYIILGRDFTIPKAISVGWTRHGTEKLCTDDKLVLETEENFEGKTLVLSRSIHRCTAVAEVTCLTNMYGKFQVQPNPIFLRDNPNVYCKSIIYDMSPDKEWIQQQNSLDSSTPEEHVKVNNIEPMNTPASPSKKKKRPQQTHTRIPFFITNLSSRSRVVLPKDHMVAFNTPENPETNYIEIAKSSQLRNNAEIGSILQICSQKPLKVTSWYHLEMSKKSGGVCCQRMKFLMKPMNHFGNFLTNTRQPFVLVVGT